MFRNNYQSSPPSVSLEKHPDSPGVSGDENITDDEVVTTERPSFGRTTKKWNPPKFHPQPQPQQHPRPRSRHSNTSLAKPRSFSRSPSRPSSRAANSSRTTSSRIKPKTRRRIKQPSPIPTPAPAPVSIPAMDDELSSAESSLSDEPDDTGVAPTLPQPTAQSNKIEESFDTRPMDTIVTESAESKTEQKTYLGMTTILSSTAFLITQVYQTFTTGAFPWRTKTNPWLNQLYHNGLSLAKGPPTIQHPAVLSPYWYTSGTVTVQFFPLRDTERNSMLPDTPHGISVFKFICFLNIHSPGQANIICEIVPNHETQVVACSKRRSIAHQNGALFQVQMFPVKCGNPPRPIVVHSKPGLDVSSWYYLDFHVGHTKAMMSQVPESSKIQAHRLAWSAKVDLIVNQL